MTFLKGMIGGQFPVEIPRIVHNYEFVRVIGEGSYAVICLIHLANSSTFYACKVVPRAALSYEGICQSFEYEVRVLQTVRHPNIVQLVDVVYTEQIIYVVMEYCSGGDVLHAIEEDHFLSEGRCRSLIRDVLLGLACLHRRNIAHRDIKPENILIDDTGHAKVADFGLSRDVFANRPMETQCGTIAYVAPEILCHKPYDGRKADVWSCGVLFYAMCCSRLPWTSQNEVELYREIVNAEYTLPGYVPRSMEGLISKMLVIDPALRATVEELLTAPCFAPAQGKRTGLVPKSSSTGRLGQGPVSASASRVVLIRPQMTAVKPLLLARVI